MKNIYQDTYLSLINEWNNLFQQKVLQSKTDYTPDEFVNKIFEDIKDKGLEQDFIIQYNLEEFNKYVNKQTYGEEKYNKFLTNIKENQSKNFSIIIINFKLYDDNKIKMMFKQKEDIELKKKEILKLKNNIKNIHLNKQKKQIRMKIANYLFNNAASLYDKCFNDKQLQKLQKNLTPNGKLLIKKFETLVRAKRC